ncbi:MAG: response regulator [Candidatus Thiodiazotropha sp.]
MERIEETTFDLILMDHEMPVNTLIEAANQERQPNSATENTPIVAVTAHVLPEKRKQVADAGINDLLPKPYLPNQLYKIIAKWCKNNNYPNPTGKQNSKQHSKDPIYDRETALASVAGNEQAARLILKEFLAMLPEITTIIKQAAEDNDNTALYQAIHKLAGSASNSGAPSIHVKAMHLKSIMKREPQPQAEIASNLSELLLDIDNFSSHFNA